MKRFVAAAAAALTLTACVANPWLPPGATFHNGCIDITHTPKYPRLDFRRLPGQPIGHWYFDGREFGWSFQEDSCIIPT